MDLRHLRTFVTVAEQGTVSKASLRLRIAQPALSRQIKELEEELNLRLFDRVRRRLVLTGEGEQLLGDCRTVLGAVGSFSERAQRLRQVETGILKVAVSPQTLASVFSTFLNQYAKQRPNVQIKLTEAVGSNLLALVERGEVHVTICRMRSLPGGNHPFESFPLPPSDFFAACHTSVQLGSAGNVDIVKLASYPLLLLDTSFGVRNTFDAACRLAGVKPKIFMESRSPQALLELAEAGHGVAIVTSALSTHRYQLRMVRITHRRRPLRESNGAHWDKRRTLPPYAKDFCEALAAHMRRVYALSKSPSQSAALPRAVAPRHV
jgi:LysR family transcriptional regulator, nitrogen assimilation regulatory protein